MSVPANSVWFPGIGSVPADQLNTYVQTVLNYAQLRTFTGQTYMLVNVLGAVSPADGGQGLFWYNASSTAADNNTTVIVPSGAVMGAWLYIPPISAAQVSSVRYVTTGTADAATSADSLIVWTSAAAADKSEILPAPTTQGRQFTIKDGRGNSATYPINVSAVSGVFDGATMVDTPFAALTFTADGVNTWVTTQGFLPSTYVVYDAAAYGVVGDGTTDDTVAIQTMFTIAASTGGMIRFPQGVFKISTPITATINPYSSLTIIGSGQEVSSLLCRSCNGIVLTYGNPFCSVTMRDMTFITDQTGSHMGVSLTLSSGIGVDASGSDGPFNTVENVSFRGADQTTAKTQYWEYGLITTGVSNLTISGGGSNGPAAPAGTAYAVNGNTSVPFYAVQINFYATIVNNANIGLFYGDFVQGVTFDAVNLTGCNYGVWSPASVSGILDQMAAVNSQFNCFTCGVFIQSPQFNNIQLSNNLFIVPANATGVEIMGTNFLVTSNTFGAESTTGTIAINVAGTYGNGGAVNGNWIDGFGEGITVAAGVSILALKLNQFTNDAGAGANDYMINASAAGVVITDDVPRNFSAIPTAMTAINYSTFKIADSNTTTFHAVITAGGGASTAVGTAFCFGTSLYYH